MNPNPTPSPSLVETLIDIRQAQLIAIRTKQLYHATPGGKTRVALRVEVARTKDVFESRVATNADALLTAAEKAEGYRVALVQLMNVSPTGDDMRLAFLAAHNSTGLKPSQDEYCEKITEARAAARKALEDK